MADHAHFALPEIRAGTLAGAATIKLPKRIHCYMAMDLLLTSRWLVSEEALKWGLAEKAARAAEGPCFVLLP